MHLFAWGRSTWHPVKGPDRFPARQTREASHALARLHQLHPDACLFPQQDPAGIDGGAFHTDVMAVGNDAFLMLHEEAFVAVEPLLATLRNRLGERVPLGDGQREGAAGLGGACSAIRSTARCSRCPTGACASWPPSSRGNGPGPRAFLERVVAEENPVTQVHYLDVRQSMNNGGGPACLRQRIRLTEEERAAVKARVFLDEGLAADLGGVDPEALPRAPGDAGPRGSGAGEGVDDRARRADEDSPDRKRVRLPADGVSGGASA